MAGPSPVSVYRLSPKKPGLTVISTSQPTGDLHAKNHPFPMVRRTSRRGHELLRFSLQEFKGCEGYSIWRSRPRTEGNGNVGDIPTRGTRILRPERGTAIYLFARYLILREL